MTDTELRVGWIGTGRMGSALVQRLSGAGLDVAVWNRTRTKADLDQVLGQLLTDPERRPRQVVDCSTVSLQASGNARQRLAERGVSLIAASVSGNGEVVRAGMLSLVCSGPAGAFAEVRPLLELLGRHVTYVGDGDNARLVKICHNLLLGVVTQNLAEITVLAQKGGVPRSAFLDFINNSVMGSVFTRYKTPAFVNLDYTPTFTPILLRKDFDLGLALAHELDVPMPLTALTAQLVQASVSSGRVSEDFAILLDLQAASAGMTLLPENLDVDDGLGGTDPS
jgi:3-hydroxyisobutyrate dehydrogenase